MHARTKGKPSLWLFGKEITEIRVFVKKWSKYRDIPISGRAYLEAILKIYSKVNSFNPSLRIENKELLKLLEE